MKTRYIELRKAMDAAGITQGQMGTELGLSHATMCFRMSGRFPFTLEEAYKILDMLKRPYSELPRLFPKDGIAANAPADPAWATITWLEAYTDDLKRAADARLQLARTAILEKQSCQQ